jgi:hypothetical protein
MLERWREEQGKEEREGKKRGRKEEGQNGALAKEKHGQGKERGKALPRSGSAVTGHTLSPPLSAVAYATI